MTAVNNSEFAQSGITSNSASVDDTFDFTGKQLRSKVLGIGASFERWGSPTIVFNVETPTSGTELLSYLAAQRSSGMLLLIDTSEAYTVGIENGAIIVPQTSHTHPKLPNELDIVLTNLCEGRLVGALWYPDANPSEAAPQKSIHYAITEWQMTYFTKVDEVREEFRARLGQDPNFREACAKNADKNQTDCEDSLIEMQRLLKLMPEPQEPPRSNTADNLDELGVSISLHQATAPFIDALQAILAHPSLRKIELLDCCKTFAAIYPWLAPLTNSVEAPGAIVEVNLARLAQSVIGQEIDIESLTQGMQLFSLYCLTERLKTRGGLMQEIPEPLRKIKWLNVA